MRLLLALLLVTAQAALLAAVLFAPRVSAQHRAFYMDRTTQCWLREGAGAIPSAEIIRPARLDPDSFCRLLPIGWALEEPFGRVSRGAWSSRPHTEIRLPVRPGDRAVLLTLHGYAPESGAQPLRVVLNGAAPRVEAAPHQGFLFLCLPIPPGAPEARIGISIGAPTRPALAGDAHDPRATGLELVEIRRLGQAGCADGASSR